MYFGGFISSSLKDDMFWKQNNHKSQNWPVHNGFALFSVLP